MKNSAKIITSDRNKKNSTVRSIKPVRTRKTKIKETTCKTGEQTKLGTKLTQ